MSTQPEIIQLRDELKKLQEQSKKSRTRGIIGTVLLVFVMVISMTYGFVKNVEAVQARIVAKSNAAEALKQREISAVHLEAAFKAQEELQRCQSSRSR